MKTVKYAAVVIALVSLAVANRVLAHCDSMDGPVIKDAQRALVAKDVSPILKWVPATNEEEIKNVFAMTIAIRDRSEQVRQVADSHFFETLVRIHRAGEGEGFTGLKPAGSVEPAIAATDRALSKGEIDELAEKIASAVRDGIKKRFEEAYQRKQVAEASAAQGREYVEAYVQLTHFIEAIDHLVSHGPSHKHEESR